MVYYVVQRAAGQFLTGFLHTPVTETYPASWSKHFEAARIYTEESRAYGARDDARRQGNSCEVYRIILQRD